MMMLKRALIMLLCIGLVVSGCKKDDGVPNTEVVEPTTMNEDETSNHESSLSESMANTETVGFDLASLTRPQKWFFDETYEGIWSVEQPYINPMGAEENYSDLVFEENSYLYLEYMSSTYDMVERSIYGDYYRLEIPFNNEFSYEENAQFLRDLTYYIQANKGTLKSIEQEQTVFMLEDGDGKKWWGRAYMDDEYVVMEVVVERELKPGVPMVIHTDELESPLYLASYQQGDRYQTLYVESDSGYASLKILTDSQYGTYSRESHISVSLEEEIGTDYIVGAMPLEESVSTYELYWDSDGPSEIILTLTESYDLEPTKDSDDFGAIKVSAAYVSGVSVTPTNRHTMSLYHPEYDGDGGRVDKTPDGDFMIYVPSGYWDVHLQLDEDAVIADYGTVGVPVSAGEMTEIKVPYPMAASMSEQDGAYDARGVAIGKVTEDQNLVRFDFTMLDDVTKELPPNLDNTKIYESGKQVNIQSIDFVDEPSKIILLIDSSGSMKGELSGVKTLAKEFVRGLPEDTWIKVIDFDSQVKVAGGEDLTSALKAIDALSVGGNTALYAALKKATELTDVSERGTIVVFTDGENDLEGNEVLTKEETIEYVSANQVPIFAIGFGEGHDGKTLTEFAKGSQGLYFDAQNQSALKEVFKSINERLGSTYRATYERPKNVAFGDMPVVTFMVDTSGSMEEVDEGKGQRINNVRNLLTPFIQDLQEDALVQIMGFADKPYVVQSLTNDKRKLLQGVTALDPGGSTDIPGAVLSTWLALKHVPSSKKVLVFITDEAMEPEEEIFIDAVEHLNKEGIEVLWVGMGVDEVEEAFAKAAVLSDSHYIVSSDIDLLSEAFGEVLENVKSVPETGDSQITIEVEKENRLGGREEYGDSTLVALTPMQSQGKTDVIEFIRESSAGPINQYNQTMASMITGGQKVGKETVITGRVTADKVRTGHAASVHVGDIVYMSRLYGVDAPSGYRFVGMETTVTNVLKEQEVTVYPDGSNHPSSYIAGGNKGVTKMMIPDYLIPDFRSHLFITINDVGTYPASDATWLTETPFTRPGVPELLLTPKADHKGMLVFMIPDEPVHQMSLHLFDVANGGVGVPLVGEMTLKEETLLTLPTTAGTKLSDVFSLAITAVKDNPHSYVEVENPDTLYREIEGFLTSNVHSMLELKPSERLHLTIPTDDGDFWFELHEATSLVPFGHYQTRSLAPGSNNKALWIYEMPKALEKMASSMYIDLKGEDVHLKITSGDTYALGKEVLYEGKGEGFKVRVHDAFITGINSGFVGPDRIVLDVTIDDVADGFSTQGITEIFDVTGEGDAYNEPLNAYTSWLSTDFLCGLNDQSIIYDGTSRRGYIVYQPETVDSSIQWTLTSSSLSGLNLEVGTGQIPLALDVNKTLMNQDLNLVEALEEAVSEKIIYQETMSEAQGIAEQTSSIEGENDGDDILVPAFSSYGSTLMQDIQTVLDVKRLLKSLHYLPGYPYQPLFVYDYSVEATLMQGFGTENEYAQVAMTLLSKLGLKVKETSVDIDDYGRTVLSEMAGKEVIVTKLPAVTFTQGNQSHTWVMPFVEELEDLSAVCYYSKDQLYDSSLKEATLSVSLELEMLNPDRNAQMDQMNNALAGDTEGGPILYLEEVMYDYIPESELSLDAIDIGFYQQNDMLNTYLIRQNGIRWSDRRINLADYKVKAIRVACSVGNQDYMRRIPVDGGREAEHIFITAGINLPDLNKAAVEYLYKQQDILHATTDTPTDLTSLRWYGRHLLTEMIRSQSLYEAELANDLEVKVGRTENKRMLLAVMKAPSGEGSSQDTFETSLDLVDCFNDVHTDHLEIRQSFNIMSGLFMTRVEADILGNQGYGTFEIMEQTPDGTDFVIMSPNLIDEDWSLLSEAGLPDHVIEHMSEVDRYILMPNQPALIHGIDRWAWLEIDPDTYATIGVVDSLEHGAMVSSVIVDTVKNSGQYMVGGFVGIASSIWAVSAISLEEDDYKTILKEAKKFALGMKDSFGIKNGAFSMGVGGKPGLSKSFGTFKFSFDGKAAFKQNIVGFTQGYEAGVNYYFDQAE